MYGIRLIGHLLRLTRAAFQMCIAILYAVVGFAIGAGLCLSFVEEAEKYTTGSGEDES